MKTTEMTDNLRCGIFLGPALQSSVTSWKACFSHPAGTDVLVANRDLKIYNATGSTTRFEFRLENEP